MKNNEFLDIRSCGKWLNFVLLTIAFWGIFQVKCFGFAQSDLNKDGVVNFLDLALMASQWLSQDANSLTDQPVNMLDGTLTRNSVAFLDGKQYVANAPRKKIMAAASASDFEVVTSVNVDGVGLITPLVHCLSGGYLWATNSSKNGLYKSNDGDKWIQVQSSSVLTGVDTIHPHSSGAIFVVKALAGSYKLYKSVDGSDLVDAGMPIPKISFDSANGVCTCTYFNFYEAMDGVICIGEYRAQGGCRGLWRSIDGGETFERAYTEADTNVKHSHRVYKQEALGKWVVVWGDGGNINKVTYSNDDGLTWADLEANIENNFQPVELYDYGHPTRLLYGSDAANTFGFYDLLTRQIEPLYWDGPSLDGSRYCWAIMQHEGVFYASIMQTDNTLSVPVESRRASIVISSDLAHWGIYHQFANELGIYRYLGVLNNKIQCILWPSVGPLQYVRFSPATVKTYNALCIDPATTNLLTANASSMETDASSWTCTGTKTSFSADSLHGSKCIQFNSNIYGDVLRFGNGINTSAGQLYSGRVAMKGYQANQGGSFYWALSGSNRTDDRQYWGLGREQWQDLPLDPLMIQPGDTALSIYIKGYGTAGLNVPNPTNLLLDCVQVELGPPTRWQVGGTPRAHENLTKTYTFGDNWTEYIIWAPATRLDYFLSGWGNQYIKCWYKDANNYLELYYSPSDYKFKLQAVIAGQPQTPISTAKTYKCYTNASVRLVVRGNQPFRLSVNYAGGWEHLTGTSTFGGIVGSKTGNYANTNVISGSYLSDLLYDYVMADERIEME